MKKFNLAALPLAVAGIVASNSAFAGTQACFEVYKGADALAVAAFDTNYAAAACIAEADRLAAGAADLEPTAEAAIAYELTGDLDVDFDALDGVDTDLHIVYIPTTDIPSGTLITMTITGATFANNADIIHLVQDEDGAGAGTTFAAVASTDGAVDGENTITFLTKAGVTITAGTRLALSQVSTGAVSTAIEPISINILNEGCTDPSSSQTVTIQANSAVTDGGTGFSIAGAASTAQLVADISPQFVTFSGSTSIEEEVNAESTDSEGAAIVARTEFVYDASATLADRFTVNASQVLSIAGFADRAPLLDQSIALDADDHLITRFVTSADPGATVEAGIYNSMTAASGVLAAQIDVETGTTFGTIAQSTADATAYLTEATDLFTAVAGTQAEAAPAALAGSVYNDVWYVLENTDPGVGVMNFNYTHTPEYTLELDTAGELDHCVQERTIHDIGVNGAVLKVPYTFDTNNNFVRITNEHNEEAEITLDIFDESGNQATSIAVGNVGEHASVVLRANELIDLAQAAGYMGVGDRHTMTFTVTAPRDSVHGVSVQAIPGGVDRVMPVLDQNVWTQ
ncbi:hypothetical protein tinsulaeT_09340 [Thalassotalea insulae]|uniref:Uncharacterized protein n=1 Tax=Thalassotalea insulae TaxID=2056778 RepID=A0ABQ6GPQ2_9GAMM|nr:hypothetical protein [Thalassotalea insulae]GLX77594.1 hypothetical protein tinsulaeT_09340 [Thalassotalea insulae]